MYMKFKKIETYQLIYTKIGFIFYFFSVLGTNQIVSTEAERENFYHVSFLKKKSQNSYIELTSFITTADTADVNEKGNICSFIEKYHIHQENIPESQQNKIFRSIGQGVATILGSLAGIPYFEVAQAAGGKNEVFRWSLGITNMIATSGTGAWSFFNLLKGLNPQSDEERKILEETSLSMPSYISAHVLGLVVAVPTGYMAAIYNTHEWLAGISYLLDYSLKSSGYLDFFKRISERNKHKVGSAIEIGEYEDPAFEEKRQRLIFQLSRQVTPSILVMSDENRNELFKQTHQNTKNAKEYLGLLLNISSSQEDYNEIWGREAFINVLSLSAILNLFHNGVCSYNAWQKIYDDLLFVIPMAILSTIPIFVLEIQATRKIGSLLYNNISNQLLGNYQPSLLEALYPKCSKIIPFACIPLAAVTSYIGRFMVMDILKSVLPQEKLRLFFVIGGFMGPFLFTVYSNYSIANDMLIKYQRSFGDTSKKNLICFIEEIERIDKLLHFAKKEEIRTFIENIE